MRKRKINAAFCSSLFMETENKTDSKTINVTSTTSNEFYSVGELVKLENTAYCILSIDVINKEIELEDSDFFLNRKTMSFDDFLSTAENPKKIEGYVCENEKISEIPNNIDVECVGCTYYDNGRWYRVKNVVDNTAVVEDLTFEQIFNVLPTQRVDFDDILPLLHKKEKDNESKSETVDISSNNSSDIQMQREEKSSEQTTANVEEAPIELLFSETDVASDADEQTKSVEIIEKTNFLIDDEIPYKTVNERIADNIKAVKLLKQLESEYRLATPEEQKILNEFTSWGGLDVVFDESKNNAYFEEVASLLEPSEYISARESILTAYFTPIKVIKAIYTMLEKCGFKGGRVLEPSMGNGRFFGCMPKEMQENSTLYGVELDSVTSKIAYQLYQKAHIRNTGFEKVDFGENIFDLAISNVPFGNQSLNDGKYNRYNFTIHDYFICKMIDSVRPGGIVVAVTSSYTMDKEYPRARVYMAKRAKLLGAFRLPDNAFGSSHTDVITDILVFQKRDETVADISDAEWINSAHNEYNGVDYLFNEYFENHPDYILGEKTVVSGRFGNKVTIKGNIDNLDSIISSVSFEYQPVLVSNDVRETIPVPEELINKPNFIFVEYDNGLYYKENGVIIPYQPKNETAEKRIRALIPLRDLLLELMTAQLNDCSDTELETYQKQLSYMYDSFVRKFGRITSRANSIAFREDTKYPLLCSLEVINDDGEFEKKADIFTCRTVNTTTVPAAQNEVDALNISLSEKGLVDPDFMQSLLGIPKEEILDKLCSMEKLYRVPFSDCYETASNYLSGYVKEKLKEAKLTAEKDDSFNINVNALEKVQPKDIPYYDIFVQLGSTWIPVEYYQEFMYELFKTPEFKQHKIKIIMYKDKYCVTDKSYEDVKSTNTYGTSRKNGYELLEDALNLISTKVYDYIDLPDGKTKAVVNSEETQVAQTKQDAIKQKFLDWVWSDYDRRTKLEQIYNEQMNNIVEREYDGSSLTFPGMNPNIELKQHQKNAVARIIQNGNTLLAHVVGAGKTYTMIAAAMEKKRIGLSSKSLFVVPNHLVQQWAGEFARLYPFANILITSKNDFTKQNRQKFCSKIATNNWDAVLMTHSQFSHISLSEEREIDYINEQIAEIDDLIEEVKASNEDYYSKQYTIRQAESDRKRFVTQLEKLMETPKDNTVTFEELGVDSLYLDEAHLFKNLKVFTKLSNVAGLTNASSKKATDLLMKVQYLNEITDYKGVVFATGTPVSNAVCELYVMQKYLQSQTLEKCGIHTFDSWVSRFGETEVKIEVKPEGTGYRTVTRLCKYHNLPELMTMFRMVADIKVSDQLKLDVPKRKDHNVAVEPSNTQKEILKSFAERAEAIRDGSVERFEDNMLCVTNDGRKLAIDQRLYNTSLDDDKKSKLNRMIRTVYRIWKLYKDSKATQLVFSDLGTPKKENESSFFDVYAECKNKLISYGVPEKEIAFIHDANSDAKKLALFDKVNKGDVRILLGSTEKLGAGTNVQKRLVAIHNLDCPWRPSDLEQRAGRIIRQGNMWENAHVYSYVTKNTFDTYLYQTVLAKAEFIAQIMSSKNPSRDMDDVDTACLNYAEIKALSTGNPAIKEKLELEEKVAKLKALKSNYLSQRYDLEAAVKINFPNEIKAAEAKLYALDVDIEMVKEYPLDEESKFSPMIVGSTEYGVSDKKAATEHLAIAIEAIRMVDQKTIGNYRGFELRCRFDIYKNMRILTLYSTRSSFSYTIELSGSAQGNLVRINNAIDNLNTSKKHIENHIDELNKNLEDAKYQLSLPFEQESEYKQSIARLNELNKKLSCEGLLGVENII